MFSTQVMEVKKLEIFLSFSCYNFKDTAAYQDTDMFKEKNLSLVQTLGNFMTNVNSIYGHENISQ